MPLDIERERQVFESAPIFSSGFREVGLTPEIQKWCQAQVPYIPREFAVEVQFGTSEEKVITLFGTMQMEYQTFAIGKLIVPVSKWGGTRYAGLAHLGKLNHEALGKGSIRVKMSSLDLEPGVYDDGFIVTHTDQLNGMPHSIIVQRRENQPNSWRRWHDPSDDSSNSRAMYVLSATQLATACETFQPNIIIVPGNVNDLIYPHIDQIFE